MEECSKSMGHRKDMFLKSLGRHPQKSNRIGRPTLQEKRITRISMSGLLPKQDH